MENAHLVGFLEMMLLITYSLRGQDRGVRAQGDLQGSAHSRWGRRRPLSAVAWQSKPHDYPADAPGVTASSWPRGVTRPVSWPRSSARARGSAAVARAPYAHLRPRAERPGLAGHPRGPVPDCRGGGAGDQAQGPRRHRGALLCRRWDENAGNFYEGLGIAALWNLPIVFVCINNVDGMGTKYEETCHVDRGQGQGVRDRVESHRWEQRGGCVPRHEGDRGAVKRGGGPAVVELCTYRLSGHSVNDRHVYEDGGGGRALEAAHPIDLLVGELGRGNGGPRGDRGSAAAGSRRGRGSESFALESPSLAWGRPRAAVGEAA